jgi:arylsulfatase A-like enzyme
MLDASRPEAQPIDSAHEGSPRSPRGAMGDALAIVLALAMVMALTYVGGVGYKLLVKQTFVAASRDLLWMAPISAAVFSAVFLSPVIVAAPRLTRSRARAASIFGATWLVAFAVLLPWTAVHRATAAFLAAGVATAAVRWFSTPARVTMLKRAGTAIVVVLLASAAVVAATGAWRERQGYAALPDAPADAPNVLFLLLDTVRADALSLYGYGRETSPAIDSLAAGGVTFDHAVATAPWTLPSHATLFTGEYGGLLSTSFRSPLDGTQETIAERFRNAGYETVGFTANLHYTGWESGLARGFLRWTDFKRSTMQVLRSGWLGQSTIVLQLLNARAKWQVGEALRHPSFLVVPKPGGEERDAAELAGTVLDWERERTAQLAGQRRPWFAFVNFFDAHETYAPPASYRTRFSSEPTERDLYDGEIAYLDHELGRMLGALRERGALDNTIIVVVSDHGEHFKEHGMSGHGNSLYYKVLHVPLVIRYDGRLPAGRRIPNVVSLRDLPATLSSLAGLQGNRPFAGIPLDWSWDGASAVASASDTARGVSANPVSTTPETSAAISELTQDAVALTDDPITRSQGVSLVEASGDHSIHRNIKGAQPELYNVRTDPAELGNLASDSIGVRAFQAQRERLQALLRRDRARFDRR